MRLFRCRVGRKFDDPDVCKYDICGFCPYSEFRRTKNDIGCDCPATHDEACRKQWVRKMLRVVLSLVPIIVLVSIQHWCCVALSCRRRSWTTSQRSATGALLAALVASMTPCVPACRSLAGDALSDQPA